LEADYRLHHFGPYSDEVAHLTDEMVQAGLLDEHERSMPQGQTYDYGLSEKSRASLAQFETTTEGKQMLHDAQQWKAAAQRLLKTDLKELEHAATLVYFRLRAKLPWNQAIEKTCQMKKLGKKSIALRRAESLARKLMAEKPTGA